VGRLSIPEAPAAVLASDQANLTSGGREQVPGGVGSSGGTAGARGGLQPPPVDTELPDLNAGTRLSGNSLCDQLAEVLEKLVTKKGGGRAPDTREGAPCVAEGGWRIQRRTGRALAHPQAQGWEWKTLRASACRAGLTTLPVRLGSKRREREGGQFQRWAPHQRPRNRLGSTKAAIEKALSAQDTAVRSAGTRETHPGLFSRRNAADGTFTPARLPRCLESLFTSPPDARGAPAPPATPARAHRAGDDGEAAGVCQRRGLQGQGEHPKPTRTHPLSSPLPSWLPTEPLSAAGEGPLPAPSLVVCGAGQPNAWLHFSCAGSGPGEDY